MAIFGLHGILLVMDRAIRRVLPSRYYRNFWVMNKLKNHDLLNVNLWIDSDSIDYENLFPDEKEKIINAANQILKHKFQLAGSGYFDFGEDINWQQDVKTKHKWENKFYSELNIEASYNSGIDVKTTWELNRFHHAVILARAYWLTSDTNYRQELIDQCLDWISKNPCPYGINWTSAMEVSIRSINLLFALLIITAKDKTTSAIPEILFNSIVEHGSYIKRNLEIGSKNGRLVSGNHLISNYSALACIGMMLSGLRQSREWIRIGLAGLDIEVKRQILPDGLHYESSLSYHKLVLEMLLITGVLAQKCGEKLSLKYKQSVSKMCDAVIVMTRPDGQLPMIGDDDGGRLAILSGYYLNRLDDNRDILSLGAILLNRDDLRFLCRDNLRELFWVTGPECFSTFSQALENFVIPECKQYEYGGLCVLQNRDRKDFILFRTGWPEFGAPTGHRHNDLLSTEIWLNGTPITVDPGTLTYTSDFKTRNELRSTKSHATVSLNSDEQNLIKLNRPFDLISKTTAGKVNISHSNELITIEGTALWTQLMSHKRIVSYAPKSGILTIEDTINEADSACWNWPLFPGVDSFESTILTKLELSEKYELFKFASSYGVASDSKILRFAGKTKKQAIVKFIFKSSKDISKNLNNDLLMVS